MKSFCNLQNETTMKAQANSVTLDQVTLLFVCLHFLSQTKHVKSFCVFANETTMKTQVNSVTLDQITQFCSSKNVLKIFNCDLAALLLCLFCECDLDAVCHFGTVFLSLSVIGFQWSFLALLLSFFFPSWVVFCALSQ